MAKRAARPAEKPGHSRGFALSDIAVLAAAMLTYVFASHGLFYYAGSVQVAAIVGIVAGAASSTMVSSAAVAAGGVLLGLGASSLLEPTASATPPSAMLSVTGMAVILAVAVFSTVRFDRQRTVLAAGLALLLLVGNLWATSLTLVGMERGGVSGAQIILTSPQPGTAMNDNSFYRRVVYLMQHGSGYYSAFRQAYHENTRWARDPSSVLSYRLPLAFELMSVMPMRPWGIVGLFLALATLATCGAAWLGAMRAGPVLAVPGAAAVAAYFLYPASTAGIFMTEFWSAPFVILAAAVLVASLRQPWRRVWTILAVASAVIAVVMRELAATVVIVGIAASVTSISRPDGRFRLAAWLGGLVVLAAAYVVHALEVGGSVSHAQSLSVFTQGGLTFFARAFDFSTIYVGGPVIVAAAVVLALLGVALSPNRLEGALEAAIWVLPLATFLLVGNAATDDAGLPVNYWAPVAIPLALASVTWVLAPGVARRAPAGAIFAGDSGSADSVKRGQPMRKQHD